MWRGAVVLEPGRLAFTGRIGDAHRHHHAAIQLVLALDGTIGLRDDAGGHEQVAAALIPAGVRHTTSGDGRGLLIFVEAGSAVGRALTTHIHRGDAPIDSVTAWAAAAAPLHGITGEAAPGDVVDAVLRASGARAGDRRDRHPALRAALARLPDLLDTPVRLTGLAAQVGLSPSRLGHLFADELGLPFPLYLRWARLRRAIDIAHGGATFTDAAHGAGFADSAHLSRVCREMFGLTPSDIAAAVRS